MRKQVPQRVIEADHSDQGDSTAIRLATMHRAKGREFDRVTVLVSRSVLESIDGDGTARRLLYVALTRAKREARIITY